MKHWWIQRVIKLTIRFFYLNRAHHVQTPANTLLAILSICKKGIFFSKIVSQKFLWKNFEKNLKISVNISARTTLGHSVSSSINTYVVLDFRFTFDSFSMINNMCIYTYNIPTHTHTHTHTCVCIHSCMTWHDMTESLTLKHKRDMNHSLTQ